VTCLICSKVVLVRSACFMNWINSFIVLNDCSMSIVWNKDNHLRVLTQESMIKWVSCILYVPTVCLSKLFSIYIPEQPHFKNSSLHHHFCPLVQGQGGGGNKVYTNKNELGQKWNCYIIDMHQINQSVRQEYHHNQGGWLG
jgi:hypothetical protein